MALRHVARVGSARGLARLTQEHDAYRWIGGGVQVIYHTLSDFRLEHGEALDDLLTDSVASLMAVGCGEPQAGGPRWHAGARQCGRGLVPTQGNPWSAVWKRRARKWRHSRGKSRTILGRR